mmetsp:Transcript_4327/g.11868  ORF Transcript_4327/g.11868 Transcript_4327/m.11868 type:complete len:126 (+) Transcript_4327:1172-1549(+)
MQQTTRTSGSVVVLVLLAASFVTPPLRAVGSTGAQLINKATFLSRRKLFSTRNMSSTLINPIDKHKQTPVVASSTTSIVTAVLLRVWSVTVLLLSIMYQMGHAAYYKPILGKNVYSKTGFGLCGR